MEMSHRSKEFDWVLNEAISDLRKLMNIPSNYKVIFVQGGGHGQFAAVPLNLMTSSDEASYIVTGAWSKKAFQEGQKLGKVSIGLTTEKEKFTSIPQQDQWKVAGASKYVYYCANETVNGVEFQWVPALQNSDQVLVCDMSSNFLSRPVDVTKYGLIWAGAQKNAGISGFAIVIIRDDLLDQARPETPTFISYKHTAESNSTLNTPPTFAIYVSGLVFKWILELGGLDAVEKLNIAKSEVLYSVIDSSDGYYKSPVAKADRSRMNIVFTLKGGEALEKQFAKEATQLGLIGLEGHRSVGGLRASLYNATPLEHVQKLAEFMKEFQKRNSN